MFYATQEPPVVAAKTTAVPTKSRNTNPSNKVTSLQEILHARDNGLGIRETAALFAESVEQLAKRGHNLYGRVLMEGTDADVKVSYPHEDGERQMIMMASNNYLGLSTHPKCIEAARDAAEKYGVGSGSSPLLVGTYPVTKALEAKLARFKKTEDACVFSTGYSANVGVISAVVGKNDVVIVDRLAHASMVDGAKLSGANVKVFKHSDAEHLDRVLSRCKDYVTKLVAIEGIYSMDGDIAPVDEILKVCRKHDAMLLVDEAHSTGVLPGGGAAGYFGVEGEIDLTVGTLSKAIGCCGGFVAGNQDLITYIRYFARSAMFSTAPSPPVMAAASAALDVIQDEPERCEQLWENCHFMHSELKRLGFTVSEQPSPIIPVIIGSMDAMRTMTLELHQSDICINSVIFPAVSKGSERLRISLTANHTREQLVEALGCLEQAGRNAGVL